MFGRTYQRAIPGSRQLPARTINRPLDDLERAQKLRSGPGIVQSSINGIPQLRGDEQLRQMARVTGAPTSGAHPWQAVAETPGGGTVDIDGFTDHSLVDPLYEDNGNTIPVNTLVEMRRGRYSGEWRTQIASCS